MSLLVMASKPLAALTGFFFSFAGVSKLSGAGPMGAEMQGGFLSGLWGGMWGLPGIPFLYTIGATELVTGLGLLGFVFGVTPPVFAQWCAVLPCMITFAATTSHVINGDPPDKVGFCAVMCFLFCLVNFGMAIGRAKAKAN